MSQIKSRQEDLERRIETVEDKLISIESNQQPNREEMVNIIKEEIKVSELDQDERQKKKNNIIIFNMPEPTEDSIEDRKENDTKEIMATCKDELEVNLEDKDLTKVSRLGKRDADKVRPVVATLRTPEIKKAIFLNLMKLKETDEDNPRKKYVIAHDQTKQQMEEGRELIKREKDLQANDQSNKWNYVVRGPPWARNIRKVEKKL